MARPKFLSRNNDNAPVAKRKADDDNVAPKHVSVPHKAQALQDLIDDSSNARPHVLYLQSLGILPASFIAKAETSASPLWAGSTTSSSSYSSDSVSFAPQANNSALGFISYLGISPLTIRAVEAQHSAIIAEQVAIQAQAAVEDAIASKVSPTQLASITSTATQAQVAATDAQVVAEDAAEEVTTAITDAVDTANSDAAEAELEAAEDALDELNP